MDKLIKTKKKKTSKSKCSFLSRSKSGTSSCFTVKQLRDILSKYNQFYGTNYKPKPTKSQLSKLLQKLISKDEMVWYKSPFLDNFEQMEMKYLLFKPKGPRGMNSWLNNNQINKVMIQMIHKLYTNDIPINFYGAVPCDHFNKNSEDINLLKKSKHSGIIFNTKGTSSKGEHWVSMWISPTEVHYFDSNGDLPNKCLNTFINKVKCDRKVIINKKEFQKKDGSCGMYSIEFILKKAIGAPLTFDKDNVLNSKRKLIFG